jgi:cytoskeletal protein CcmA (bactofilin family)
VKTQRFTMWKRDEVVRPLVSGRDITGQPAPGAPAFSSDHAVHAPEIGPKDHVEKDVINIGKSVVIKGELNGSEDLTVEGSVEGRIELRDHVLTIGSHGKITAEVFAKVVVIVGEVVGNITASEKVEIRENGSVDGNIVAPRVAIAEGSHFRGSVDMKQKPAVAPVQAAKAEAKPAPVPAAPLTAPGPRMVGT